MATLRFRSVLLAAGLLTLIACGGQSADTPIGLDTTTYAAGAPFTMFVTMVSCTDPCAEYDEPSCSVNVKDDEATIEINASLTWSRTTPDGECSELCGGPSRKASCEVPALSAGTYEVVSGSFQRTITVR